MYAKGLNCHTAETPCTETPVPLDRDLPTEPPPPDRETCADIPHPQIETPLDRQTPVKILPYPKLRLRAVIK